ncbi:hypothetical protein MSAN_00879100 [Mycena sanguinolenta]|uniref:Uncharacterized protein n=1 Tax=Mycena sanguinolenta TaxID=230812 RepID=A0A8H7DDI4_9AGAR|nr:hypothetical protein MSAN_00879100 [Mycena sanguinolenta]
MSQAPIVHTLMILFSLVNIALATAALAQTVPVGQSIAIRDFQGNVFDLADRSTQPFSPVQSLNFKPGEAAQIWVIEQNGTQFTIRNVISESILSTTATIAGTPSDRKSIQLVGGGANVAVPQWNISANGASFNIIDPLSQLAVTSWLATTSSIITPTTPLTLQLFDPKATQQIFTFVNV